MEYREYNDYELLSYISENHEDASNILYQKYQPYIQKCARKLYPYVKGSGIEINDLVQEGMLGLTNAIYHFKEKNENTFYTFATTCIRRKMISMVVATKRLKNKILNESIPIDSVDDTGANHTLEYLLGDETANPESVLISNEYEENIIEFTKDKLTPLESAVFELKVSGFGYKEISVLLEKDVKVIDNALQRVRLKLKEVMQSEE